MTTYDMKIHAFRGEEIEFKKLHEQLKKLHGQAFKELYPIQKGASKTNAKFTSEHARDEAVRHGIPRTHVAKSTSTFHQALEDARKYAHKDGPDMRFFITITELQMQQISSKAHQFDAVKKLRSWKINEFCGATSTLYQIEIVGKLIYATNASLHFQKFCWYNFFPKGTPETYELFTECVKELDIRALCKERPSATVDISADVYADLHMEGWVCLHTDQCDRLKANGLDVTMDMIHDNGLWWARLIGSREDCTKILVAAQRVPTNALVYFNEKNVADLRGQVSVPLPTRAPTPPKLSACKLPLYENVFACPITCEVFVDPVVARDGHTYERFAIEAWVQEQLGEKMTVTSPMTGEEMESDVVPNYAFQQLLDKYKCEQLRPFSGSTSSLS